MCCESIRKENYQDIIEEVELSCILKKNKIWGGVFNSFQERVGYGGFQQRVVRVGIEFRIQRFSECRNVKLNSVI